MGRRATLKNWLGRANCETVKIGCERGSSFVYCGPIEDDLYETLEKENKAHLKERQKLEERRQRILNELADIDLELAQPEDVLERKVVNTYPSTNVPGQLIVEISGIWSGKYWDIEEYQKGKKERRKRYGDNAAEEG